MATTTIIFTQPTLPISRRDQNFIKIKALYQRLNTGWIPSFTRSPGCVTHKNKSDEALGQCSFNFLDLAECGCPEMERLGTDSCTRRLHEDAGLTKIKICFSKDRIKIAISGNGKLLGTLIFMLRVILLLNSSKHNVKQIDLYLYDKVTNNDRADSLVGGSFRHRSETIEDLDQLLNRAQLNVRFFDDESSFLTACKGDCDLFLGLDVKDHNVESCARAVKAQHTVILDNVVSADGKPVYWLFLGVGDKFQTEFFDLDKLPKVLPTIQQWPWGLPLWAWVLFALGIIFIVTMIIFKVVQRRKSNNSSASPQETFPARMDG